MYLELTLLAFIIDKIFGEFSFIKFYKHPVVFMGDFIKLFEKYFYKDSIYRGTLLNASLLSLVFIIIYIIDYFIDNIYLIAFIASTGIASKMLHNSVKDLINHPENIKYLVSRDTSNLSNSDINKAAIETYAENLSDGVIAPLFYLFFFGLYGLFIYKAINTLDSMVGYRNERYENFGKFSAKLDDMVNYIPSRITALLISLLFASSKALFNFHRYGKKHESPNAGHPISAMALSIGVKLGGDTSYFGIIKSKPYFGDGKMDITTQDLINALKLQKRLDIFILSSLIVLFTTSLNGQTNIDKYTSQFLNTPYKANTLIGNINTKEQLIVNSSSFDCFTFIDYIEASKSDNITDAMQTIRYKDKTVSYTNRNHFFSDWSTYNPNIKDISCEVGICIKTTKYLNKKSSTELYLKGIDIVKREISYITANTLNLDLLLDGDYIGIYTRLNGLDVTHVGIAINKEGIWYLRHASSKYKKVIDSKLIEYIKNKDGIVIYRSSLKLK